MPITSSPCETFRWRDRTGNLHSPATLATEYLFSTLRRIWNYTMPMAARLPGGTYPFSAYYKTTYLKDAIRAFAAELEGRSNLAPEWRRELNFMLDWLAGTR